MAYVRVTIPAAALNLGPGIDCLGLALALHNTVEMSLRSDDEQRITVAGASELAGEMVLRGVEMIMHLINRPLPGLDIYCQASIPSRCGLGDDEAWLIGGLMAINNLLGAPLHREKIAEIAVKLTSVPTAAITELMGGLTVINPASTVGGELLYRRLEITSMKVVLVVPEVANYRAKASELALRVANSDYKTNISNAILVAEAMRKGDYKLLSRAMVDPILMTPRLAFIPGGDAAILAAKSVGAAAVTISGDGPTLVMFAPANHEQIAAVADETFRRTGVACRTWIVGVDTQGVAISLRG
ncbi:MAG: hypothetical protein KF716_06115 [Anaerolineae bacterium]|nr:hypothetical protein [Anaerolineae bacterium]